MTDDQIYEEVVNIVKDFWNDSRRPLHLTAVKKVAKNNWLELDLYLAGRRLKQFLELNNQHYQLVRPKEDSTGAQWALLPLDVDADIAFATTNRDDSEGTEHSRRYDPGAFAAFIKPLGANHERFIVLGDKIRFYDLSQDQPPPPNAISIEQEFINRLLKKSFSRNGFPLRRHSAFSFGSFVAEGMCA